MCGLFYVRIDLAFTVIVFCITRPYFSDLEKPLAFPRDVLGLGL